MKNWIRIFLVCFVLIGGTAFFAYQALNQFNNALDDLSASSFAIAKIPPSPLLISDKKNKEKISTSTPDPETISTSTPEIILASATSTDLSATTTDLKVSFIFPKENSEVYIGCTYQLSFRASTTIHSLETTLIDDGSIKAVEPTASGLAMENKIKPGSQSLDWKVKFVWPGEYYIKVSNINGVDLENYSEVFTIRKMPKNISAGEREKICKESDGSL